MKVMHREPTHPGVFLEEDYLKPLGLTHAEAAKLLEINEGTLEALLHKELSVSQELAINLERVFKTEWEFWMNAQKAHDAWRQNQININLFSSVIAQTQVCIK